MTGLTFCFLLLPNFVLSFECKVFIMLEKYFELVVLATIKSNLKSLYAKLTMISLNLN